jgi:molybdate transport system substrate-binding protein
LLALTPPPADAAEITVGAATSLMHALQEIGRDFEAANPDARIHFHFAVSDALVGEIINGTPIDVFVPDDDELMDRVAPVMLAGTRRDVAANRLVLIVPPAPAAAGTPPLASLADLATSRVERIAVCNPPQCPAGRYAKGALDRANLWAAVQPKFVYGADAREVRDHVVRGEVGAGFVYATDASIVGERVKVAFYVPTLTPIRYSAAILRTSPEADLALAFIQYLRSAPARQVLARYGFAGV